MWHRCDITYPAYFKPHNLQCPYSSLAARARSGDIDFNLAHTMIHGNLGCRFYRILGSKGCTFS